MDTVGGEIRINQVKITVFLFYLCRYIDIEIKGWVLRDGCDCQLFWSDPEYNRRLVAVRILLDMDKCMWYIICIIFGWSFGFGYVQSSVSIVVTFNSQDMSSIVKSKEYRHCRYIKERPKIIAHLVSCGCHVILKGFERLICCYSIDR